MWIFGKSNSATKAKIEQRNELLQSVNQRISKLREWQEAHDREMAEKNVPAGWAKSGSPLRSNKWGRDNHYWWEGDVRDSNKKQRYSEPILRSQEWPTKEKTLPDWVEQYPGYKATAWTLVADGHPGMLVTLVTYEVVEPSLDAGQPSFAKITFTVDGVPFKQMCNLWKEVAKSNKEELELHGPSVAKNYTLNEDGRLRDKTNGFLPDAESVTHAMEDLLMVYVDWEKFPDITDHSVVAKLAHAWKNVEAMHTEERSKRIQSKITELRENIKNCQQNIARLEKEENELYEKAADALNTLEEHGIGMKQIEEFNEKKLGIRAEIDLQLLDKLARGMGLTTTHNASYSLAP